MGKPSPHKHTHTRSHGSTGQNGSVILVLLEHSENPGVIRLTSLAMSNLVLQAFKNFHFPLTTLAWPYNSVQFTSSCDRPAVTCKVIQKENSRSGKPIATNLFKRTTARTAEPNALRRVSQTRVQPSIQIMPGFSQSNRTSFFLSFFFLLEP